MEKLAIGLVGGLASGKDSFGRFIQNNRGGELVSSSDVARKYISKNGLGEPTRDLTRNTAAELRQENGFDYLLRQSLEDIENSELSIISGLYVTDEVIALRGLRKSIIVHVDTSPDVRARRAAGRSRSSDEQDINNFYRLDQEDMHSNYTDQRLSDVIEMSDIKVNGDVPIVNTEYWNEQLHRVFSWFKNEGGE